MDTAQESIGKVLEPGEMILWSGRPEVEGAMKFHARSLNWNLMLGVGFVAVFAWFMLQGQDSSGDSGVVAMDISAVIDQLPFDKNLLWGVVAIAVLFPVLLPVFKLDVRSRLKRHYKSQTYAITNRRLLILDGEEIMKVRSGRASYSPEDIVVIQLRERAGFFGDVIFARYATNGGSADSAPSLIAIEKSYVGFKAQSNASDLKRRVEAWKNEAVHQDVKETRDFLDGDVSEMEAAASSTIENKSLGLQLVAPQAWEVQVRSKKKPFGKTFIDREKWRELGISDDWNLVKIKGPGLYQVEVEVFITPPLAMFEALAGRGGLADKVSGEIADSNPEFEMAGLTGFMVERQQTLGSEHKSGSAVLDGSGLSQKIIVLQEPNKQVTITAVWAANSPELGQVINRILDSIEIS